PEYRWAFLRLGLSGADRLDPDPVVRRARQRARPAAGLDAVQPVRRGLPGQDSVARPAAQAARAAVRAASAAMDRTRRSAPVVLARRPPAVVYPGHGIRRALAARDGWA